MVDMKLVPFAKALDTGAAIKRVGSSYICDGDAVIRMHRGSDPRTSSTWLTHELLEVVRAELAGWQGSPFACRENALALTHVEEALLWMAARAERRERGRAVA